MSIPASCRYLAVAAVGICALTVYYANAAPQPEGVLVNFAPLSGVQEGDLTIIIEFADGDNFRFPMTGSIDVQDTSQGYHVNLTTGGIKAVWDGKSQVRVLGYTKDGKFHPAVKGSVKSKSLKLEQLPTVINCRKA